MLCPELLSLQVAFAALTPLSLSRSSLSNSSASYQYSWQSRWGKAQTWAIYMNGIAYFPVSTQLDIALLQPCDGSQIPTGNKPCKMM